MELQRLAIEKKELEAQLAEVKKLMRARKARPNAALIGMLDPGAGTAPKKHRGERLTPRRRRKRRRKKPRRSLTAPSLEDAGVARSAVTETRQGSFLGQESNEPFDTSTERRVAGNGERTSSSPTRAARGGGRHTPRRRRRKRSGERGRETRRRPHKVHATSRGSPDANAEKRRRTPEHAGKRTVAFNTTVPVERPATAGVVQVHSSPRGRQTDSGRKGSPTRRLQRPKSASRRSRSAPSPSMHRTPKNLETKNGSFAQEHLDATRQGGRRKEGGGQISTRANGYDPRTGRSDDTQDDEKRRVYFAEFPIRGRRSPAAMKSRVEIKGGGQGASMSPPRITHEREKSHNTSSASYYLDDDSYDDESAAVNESVNYYEDDFEVVSARGSYESDFEPWENSKSDFELREQSESVESHLRAPKGKQVLALERDDRSPRVEAIMGTDNRVEARDQRSLLDSDERSGGEYSEPSGDGLLRSGENWGDGRHRPATTSRVVSGGAASWKEWNQPDDEPPDFALSGGWDTMLPPAAARRDDESSEGNAESAAAFDYLWVDEFDDASVRNAEEKSDDAGESRSSRHADGMKPDRDHEVASGEEHYSVRPVGGQPPLGRSKRADDGENVRSEFRQKNREEERVSTASLSDGGASLYDILVSSHDESGSDETWSLDSYDRRDDATTTGLSMAHAGAGTSAEMPPVPRSRPSLPRSVNNGRETDVRIVYSATRGSSDGSSLYDVTSRAGDPDEDIPAKGGNALVPRHLRDETRGQQGANRDLMDAAGLYSSAQKKISPRPPHNARASPSEVKVGAIAAVSMIICNAEDVPRGSHEPLFDEVSVGVRPKSFDKGSHQKHSRKVPLPQRPSFRDADAIGHRGRGQVVTTGHELEYNGSFDEYSLDWSNGSPTNGVAGQGDGGDETKQVADKHSFDELPTGDRLSQASAGSAEGGRKRDDRRNDGVKPARGQDAAMGRGYGRGSNLEPEESFDQLSSLGEQGQTYEDYRSTEGRRSSAYASRLSAQGREPFEDEDRNRNAARFDEGQRHVVDTSQLVAEESLDELSSLEKPGEARREQFTGEVFAQAEEPSVDGRDDRGTSSTRVGGGGTVNSSQVAPEESLDQLSSLIEQGEPYEGYRPGEGRKEAASVGQLSTPASGPSQDGNLRRGVAKFEEGQSRVVDGSQLEAEGPLDELSSVEKQGSSLTGQSNSVVFTQQEEPSVTENRIGGRSSPGVGGGGTVSSSQPVPEESVDELSSFDKQGEPFKYDNLRKSTLLAGAGEVSSIDADGALAKAEGVSIDENRAHGAWSVEEGQSRGHEAEGSLDELSSLEKQRESGTEQSKTEMFAQAEKAPVIKNAGRSMSSNGVPARGAVNSSQVAPEESLDELSSLGKQGEPSKDDNIGSIRLSSDGGRSSVDAGRVFARAKGLHADEGRRSGSPSVKEGQNRVLDGSQLDVEGSLDELSSLEKQGEFRTERSTEGVFPQAEQPSFDERIHRGTRSTGLSEGGIIMSSQLALEESLDELSSLGKQGDPNKDGNLETSRLSSEEWRSSVDASGVYAGAEGLPVGEAFVRGAPSTEKGQSPVTDGNQLEAEESLDELSSLEKQGESGIEQSAGEVFAQAEEPFIVENRNRNTSSTGEGEGKIAESSQLVPEESLDELSSLDKHGETYNEDTPVRLLTEGQESAIDSGRLSTRGREPPVAEQHNRGEVSTVKGQRRVVDSFQLDAEESLDELSSLERRGESRTGQSADDVFAHAEEPSVDESVDRGTRGCRVGGEGTVNSAQQAPDESLDETSSLDKQGERYEDDEFERLSGEGVRSSVDPGGSSVGGDRNIEDNHTQTAQSIGGGQGRTVDRVQREAEESLDELSSLERQIELQQKPPTDERDAQAEEPSADENRDRGTRSTGPGEGGTVNSSQLVPEESLDELSSLEKYGEPQRTPSTDKLIAPEPKPVVDEERYRVTRRTKVGEGGTINGSRLAPKESLDGLSSQEEGDAPRREQPYDRRSAAGGESSIDEYDGNADKVDADHGLSNQVQAEESVDELSSVDRNGENSRHSELVAAEQMLLRDRQPEKSDQPLDNGNAKRLLVSLDSLLPVPTVHSQAIQPDLDKNGLEKQLLPVQGDLPLLASVLPPGDESNMLAPFRGGEESLDEYLFDSGGASPFDDLPSLSGSLFSGGRARGFKAAGSGDGSSSIGKHSLDQSLGGLSSADDSNSQLYDAISLTGPAVSSRQSSSFGGSLSDDLLV